MRSVDVVRKDGNTDSIIAYNIQDFPFDEIDRKRMNVAHKKDIKTYCYAFATFDIESTTIEPFYNIDKNGKKCYQLQPYGFMYHWQMCVDGICVFGRTWDEYIEFNLKLAEHMKIDKENRFVIFVHNLSYEFEFCRLFWKKYFGGYSVFAPQKRKPLRVECENGFEFRCSYKLSNMSLNACTNKELGVVHVKAKGDLDYSITRTKSTELDGKEFGYCISDVLSLWEYIKCKLKNDNDNLESMPMTSTGYVRRRTRKSCKKNPKYREKVFQKCRMIEPVYILLTQAARGGNTHANRFLSNKILESTDLISFDSYDVQSSYPAQMVLQKYPMSAFTLYGKLENEEEFRTLLSKYACLFTITLVKPHLKENVTIPYIPTAKVLAHGQNTIYDNGRILESDFMQMTITDVDFAIIESQYDFEGKYVTDMHIAEYDYLPKEIIDVVMEYFTQKCVLKWDKSHESDSAKKEEIEYLYGKKKNELNGIFGMMYTNPVRDEVKELESGEWVIEPVDIAAALEKFYKSRNNFLVYAWGVWITAHARAWLQRLIDCADSSNNGLGYATAYVDTDSCKGLGIDDNLIQELNREIESMCIERKAYVDYQGERYYLGVYEHENNEPIKKFKTLGAKKYCYEDSEGLHLTVSGVNKKIGAKELGTIDNFKVGFIFKEGGGQTLYYNDDNEIHEIEINGERFITGSNIGMVDSTYTIGITDDYAELIGFTFE